MAILKLLMNNACDIHEYIRSFFRRKPANETHEWSLRRNTQKRVEVAAPCSGVEHLGVNAICDKP